MVRGWMTQRAILFQLPGETDLAGSEGPLSLRLHPALRISEGLREGFRQAARGCPRGRLSSRLPSALRTIPTGWC